MSTIPTPTSRRQTLSSFAQRDLLLTDDMLLKHLHDEDAVVREMANLILKTRGLSQELISLGGLIFSPKPDQRVSVIPLLKDRTDVDLGHLADPALARPGRDGADQRDRGTGQAQDADRSKAAGRDGPHRQFRSRAPGGPQARPRRSTRRRPHCPPCPARRA